MLPGVRAGLPRARRRRASGVRQLQVPLAARAERGRVRDESRSDARRGGGARAPWSLSLASSAAAAGRGAGRLVAARRRLPAAGAAVRGPAAPVLPPLAGPWRQRQASRPRTSLCRLRRWRNWPRLRAGQGRPKPRLMPGNLQPRCRARRRRQERVRPPDHHRRVRRNRRRLRRRPPWSLAPPRAWPCAPCTSRPWRASTSATPSGCQWPWAPGTRARCATSRWASTGKRHWRRRRGLPRRARAPQAWTHSRRRTAGTWASCSRTCPSGTSTGPRAASSWRRSSACWVACRPLRATTGSTCSRCCSQGTQPRPSGPRTTSWATCTRWTGRQPAGCSVTTSSGLTTSSPSSSATNGAGRPLTRPARSTATASRPSAESCGCLTTRRRPSLTS